MTWNGRFYLGTHQPRWLSSSSVPLFVSHRRLRDRKRMPRAMAPWALDSGGFSELSLYGRWTIDAKSYAQAVIRYADEIGNLQWAAPQDWMCEAWILAKTGKTIRWHQDATIDSVGELRALVGRRARIIPVLQGDKLRDYEAHLEAYDKAGFALRGEPLVGVGSVCRRQKGKEAAAIIRALAGHGLRLHGFGFKVLGLRQVHRELATADSMAWSFEARRRPALLGCRGRHKNCANCIVYALMWRDRLLDSLQPAAQQELFAA